MKTYNSLRNLCAFWLMASFLIGAALGIGGGIVLVQGRADGLIGIIAGIALVLTTQTIGLVIDVLIDIALHLQSIAARDTLNTKQPETIRRLPPQLEK